MQVLQRLQPNEIMCNAQISACAARGQLPQALHLLKEMHQRNIKRSSISFNSAAEACQKSLEWEGALQIFNMMMEEHSQPDVVTMSLVTSPLEVAGKTALLPPLLSSVPKLGFDPEAVMDESQKMTAMEILVEHDILSNFVEHQFHRSEWISLKGRLEHLSSPQGAASASEKAAGRLFDNRLNGYFSLGAHFTYGACNSFFPPSAGWIDLARANARCDGAWSQEASAHGLSAWIQFCVCPSLSSRTATYGYGSTDGEALLPLVVQHDRSRHSERLALLSVLHHLHHQSVSLPVQSSASKHAEVEGGLSLLNFVSVSCFHTFPYYVPL